MGQENKIWVRTVDDTIMRKKSGITELKIKELAGSVNEFLTQIESIFKKAPDQIGKFKFNEFVVSAEISASGKLMLLGSGVEAAAKGSLSFKFERAE